MTSDFNTVVNATKILFRTAMAYSAMAPLVSVPFGRTGDRRFGNFPIVMIHLAEFHFLKALMEPLDLAADLARCRAAH